MITVPEWYADLVFKDEKEIEYTAYAVVVKGTRKGILKNKRRIENLKKAYDKLKENGFKGDEKKLKLVKTTILTKIHIK